MKNWHPFWKRSRSLDASAVTWPPETALSAAKRKRSVFWKMSAAPAMRQRMPARHAPKKYQ